ncbi:hypothetical protein E2I00_014911 [Balaenoptera physalus]|uniref:Zonadhesin n=1 Tax=Balaenoptera physalus TaxID=9770 RepID=A0A643CDD7_BALPH|nr:hypothetical protein E2I00_014911 [Balaenoptera physalus]
MAPPVWTLLLLLGAAWGQGHMPAPAQMTPDPSVIGAKCPKMTGAGLGPVSPPPPAAPGPPADTPMEGKRPNVLWKHMNTQSPSWIPTAVTVPMGLILPSRLTFEGVRGSTAYLDIALDAISIRRGSCNRVCMMQTCSFDTPNDLCGWSWIPTASGAKWVQKKGSTGVLNVGPEDDFSSPGILPTPSSSAVFSPFQKPTFPGFTLQAEPRGASGRMPRFLGGARVLTQNRQALLEGSKASASRVMGLGPSQCRLILGNCGFYMLLDPKNAKPRQRSALLSPLIQSSGCLSLSFHYTLHGQSPGAALMVYASVLGRIRKHTLFSGQPGPNWQPVSVNYTGQGQIQFTVVGVFGKIPEPVVAVDAISIAPCGESFPQCDFEDEAHPFCDWVQTLQDGGHWTQGSKNTLIQGTGPLGVSLNGGEEMEDPSSQGVTESAPSYGFTYYMYGLGNGTELRLLLRSPADSSPTSLWERVGSQSADWLNDSITVPSGRQQPMQLMFEAERGTSTAFVVALGFILISHGTCQVSCPPNAHYEHCACPASCQSPTPNCGLLCKPGCVCDPGFLFSDSRCINASSCNCFYNDNYYKCGTRTVCQLKNGQYGCHPYGETLPSGCSRLSTGARAGHWVGEAALGPGLVNQLHMSPASPRQALPPASSMETLITSPSTGGTLTSWASAPTSWPNPVATRQPFFRLTVKNKERVQEGVSCLSKVYVTLPETTITLLKGRHTLVGGQRVTLPAIPSKGIFLTPSGRFVQLQTAFGLRVRWDGDQQLSVSVPSTYSSKLCGFCGNYDGDSSNDNRKPDGRPARDETELGSSWQASEDGDQENQEPRLASPLFSSLLCCTPPRLSFFSLLPFPAEFVATTFTPSPTISQSSPGDSEQPRLLLVRLQVFPPLGVQMSSTRGCREPADCWGGVGMEEAGKFCSLIPSDLASLLRACLPYLRASSFFDNCMFDMCNFQGLQQMLCAHMSALTETCQDAGYVVKPWRGPQFCPVLLRPLGQSAPVVLPLGSSLQAPFRAQEVEAEFLGSLSLLKDFSRYLGPIFTIFSEAALGARPSSVGERWFKPGCRQLCICEGSNRTRCVQWRCQAQEVCGRQDGIYGCHAQGSATCTVSGDPHYLTFDGALHHFMGTCTYTLTRPCWLRSPENDFIVSATNEFRGGNLEASYVKAVQVQVFNLRISMIKGRKVVLDGRRVALPVWPAQGRVNVRSSGSFILLYTDFGLQVRYDGNHLVEVTVPSSYAGRLCGMCGNFNNNSLDDNLQPDKRPAVSSVHLGASWKLNELSEPGCFAAGGKPPRCLGKKVTDAWNKNCDILMNPQGPFSQCHGVVAPHTSFTSCVYGQCGTKGDVLTLCRSLQAYASLCARAGQALAWRNTTSCRQRAGNHSSFLNTNLFLALNCPLGSSYSTCANPCPTTCLSLSTPSYCPSSLPCAEGCECQKGHILSGTSCVPLSQCGCTSQRGSYHPVGESWYTDSTCSRLCTCSAHNNVSCLQTACKPGQMCWSQDGLIRCRAAGMGECRIRDTSHYVSFDGSYHAVRGTCTYVLVKICHSTMDQPFFKISGKNGKRKDQPHTFYLRQVHVDIFNTLVTLKKDQVLVSEAGGEDVGSGDGALINGTQVTLPATTQIRGVKVISRDGYTVLTINIGVQVKFDGSGFLEVEIPKAYYEKTCGMCGNFNGEEEDELLMPNDEQALDDVMYVDSWQDKEIDPNCQEDDKKTEAEPQEKPNTNCRAADLARAQEQCQAAFQAPAWAKCATHVILSPFLLRCTHSLCEFGDLNHALCQSLQAFGAACQAQGITPPIWRNSSFCRECVLRPPPNCSQTLFPSHSGYLPALCSCHTSYTHTPVTCLLTRCTRVALLRLLADLGFPRRVGRTILALLCPRSQHTAHAQSVFPTTPPPALDCSAYSVYTTCVPSCPPSCWDPEGQCKGSRVPSTCEEGCVCEPGYVLSGPQCVPRSQCSCRDAQGNSLPAGKSWFSRGCSKRCACRAGAVQCWPFTCPSGSRCQPNEDGKDYCAPEKSEQCTIYGDPRYHTFDGLSYRFQGRMTYFLIKTLDVLPDGVEPLVVEGRNKVYPSFNPIFLHEIIVMVYGYTVQLQTELRLVVNGQKMAIPYEPNDQLRVTMRGHRLYLITDFELVISFNGKNNAVISLPITYRRLVRSLCGNYDQNKRNDFMLPNGALTQNLLVFGNSWEVKKTMGGLPCFSRHCVSDLCAARDPIEQEELRCQVLSGYAIICQEAGVAPPQPHHPVTPSCCFSPVPIFAPPHVLVSQTKRHVKLVHSSGSPASTKLCALLALPCSANTVYQSCMTPCPASCATLAAPRDCKGPCVEGCASLPGYIYSGAQSLPLAHCGCTNNGIYYQVWAGSGRPRESRGAQGEPDSGGEPEPHLPPLLPLQQGDSFVTEDCSQRCTCANLGVLLCEPLSCSPGEICTLGNLTRGCFREASNFVVTLLGWLVPVLVIVSAVTRECISRKRRREKMQSQTRGKLPGTAKVSLSSLDVWLAAKEVAWTTSILEIDFLLPELPAPMGSKCNPVGPGDGSLLGPHPILPQE